MTIAIADTSDDELIGVLCAWDRLEAHMAARKLAAAAELIRRRPGPDCPPKGAALDTGAWDEFTGDELGYALAEGRGRGEDLLTLAQALEARLPGHQGGAAGRHHHPGQGRGHRLRSPRCWTPKRPARPRRWCWVGPGG